MRDKRYELLKSITNEIPSNGIKFNTISQDHFEHKLLTGNTVEITVFFYSFWLIHRIQYSKIFIGEKSN